MNNQEVAKALDDLFTSFDLEAKPYLLSGRQYHGTHEDRGLHIYTRAVKISNKGGQSRYMGHNLEILLDSPLKTRAALSHAGSVTGFIDRSLSGLEPVPVLDFTQKGFNFKALEPHWAMSLVDEAKALMLQIAEQDKQTGFISLRIYPEAVGLSLRLHWEVIKAEKVKHWLEQIHHLARLAESLPSPSQPVEESKNEHDLRLKRGISKKALVIGIAIVLGLLALPILTLMGYL